MTARCCCYVIDVVCYCAVCSCFYLSYLLLCRVMCCCLRLLLSECVIKKNLCLTLNFIVGVVVVLVVCCCMLQCVVL